MSAPILSHLQPNSPRLWHCLLPYPLPRDWAAVMEEVEESPYFPCPSIPEDQKIRFRLSKGLFDD